MYKLFLIALLSTFGSIAAMDHWGNANHFPTKTTRVLAKNLKNPLSNSELTPGKLVTWHKREYTVTKRIEQNEELTIVMARGTHTLFDTPFGIEHITRIYKRNSQDPESTFATYTLAPASITTVALLTVLLTAYAIAPQ